MKLSLTKGETEVSFSLYLSPLPVYFSSYRSLSFSSRGLITLGEVKIESETKRNFAKGKEEIDASLSLYYQNWKVKLSKSSGLSISMSFNSSSFTVTKEKIETKVVLRKNGIEMNIYSSGEKSVEGKIGSM